MKLKVTRKNHTRYEGDKVVTYKTGDVFEGTERELAAFKDRLVNIEAPAAGKKDKAKEGGEGGSQ